MYKYWCSGGSFHIKCQQKFFKNHLRAVGPKMHGKAKRWINHLNGEGGSGKFAGDITTVSCSAVGAGGSPDVFKKTHK